jgi:predicted DNA-binding transcriptional regulator YafY
MNLVSALLASKGTLPFREIAGRVIGYDDGAGDEALEKRFDRDKADLRRLGIPIEYVTPEETERPGYVIRQERVFQQKVDFTAKERLILAIAGRVGAAATGGGALEEALKGALRKLAVDLPGLDPLAAVSPITVLRARSGDPRAMDNLAALSQAITTNLPVTFGYRGLHREGAEIRSVDPYGVGLARGAWYFAGYCHDREAIRVFKISRIEGAVRRTPAGRKFDVPHGFRMDQVIGPEAWDFGDGDPQEVRLSLAPGAAHLGAVPGARELERRRDGRLVVALDVRRPERLVPWILSQGGQVAVEEPQSLREAVQDEARRLLVAYEHGPEVPSLAGTEADS